MKAKVFACVPLFVVVACGPDGLNVGTIESSAVLPVNAVEPMSGAIEASVRRPTQLSIVKPLTISGTTFSAGETVKASITYANKTGRPYTFQYMVLTSRPPGGTHAGGPFDDLAVISSSTTLQPASTQRIGGSWKFVSTNPLGTWEVYASYEDAAGNWHDSPSVFLNVVAPGSGTPDAGGTGSATPDAGSSGGMDAGTTGSGADAASGAIDSGTTQGAPDSGSGGVQDAGATGTPPDAGSTSGGAVDAGSVGSTSGWLATKGNHIVHADTGAIWMGRGVNIHDTRSCDACTSQPPDVAEVERRIDEAVDVWHATFLRLDLESYSDNGGFRVQWEECTLDSGYMADIQTIVQYIGTKPGVYVLVSIWNDPSLDVNGWPTTVTGEEWTELSYAFLNVPYVMYGLSNEPQSNDDGSLDAACWSAMNTTATAIRTVEDSNGARHHIITAQGTREWARILDYYETNPLAVDNGDNVAYETHIYDPTSVFQSEFIDPSATLPVIIGEFGPVDSAGMTMTDTQNLMDTAESLSIPYLAWTFHMRCSPNLLVDNSNGGCGVGMALQPTSWGQQVMAEFAKFYP
jgi:hypothetical protein